ncbi:AAWKG family protein [Streptomyces parvulus]|uniref:AAWKG family protein n=1 Tax=Streptomyces parvulus TaxID=146923 RepID=UPI00341FB61E
MADESDHWARAVEAFTGYPMPSRDGMFEDLRGLEPEGNAPLVKVVIEDREFMEMTDGAYSLYSGPNVDGHDFVIHFYLPGQEDPTTKDNLDEYSKDELKEKIYPKLRKVLIDFVGPNGGDVDLSTYNPFGWSKGDGGSLSGMSHPLGQYVEGAGSALYNTGFENSVTHTNVGLTSNGKSVDAAVAMDFSTFTRTAEAYDRVAKFFTDHAETLKQWKESLGEDNAAWKGKAAEVFANLIDGLNKNYTGFADQMHPTDFSAVNESLWDYYASSSKQGDAILGAGNALFQAIRDLSRAHTDWESGVNVDRVPLVDAGEDPIEFLPGLASPYGIVFSMLQSIETWAYNHNARFATWGYQDSSGYGDFYQTVDGYSEGKKRTYFYALLPEAEVTIPGLGNLNDVSTWAGLGTKAVESWIGGVDEHLVPAANIALSSVNNAFVEARRVIDEVLEPEVTSYSGTDGAGGGSDEEVDELIDEINAEAEAAIEEANANAEKAIADAEAAIEEANAEAEEAIAEANAAAEIAIEEANAAAEEAVAEADAAIEEANAKAEEAIANANQETETLLSEANAEAETAIDKANEEVSLLQEESNLQTEEAYNEANELVDQANADAEKAINEANMQADEAIQDANSQTETLISETKGRLGESGDAPPFLPVSSQQFFTNQPPAEFAMQRRPGGVITENPDGSLTTDYPDGTEQVVDPDGTVTQTDPDGTVTITDPDGTVAITDPDGNVRVEGPGGEIIGNSDGETIISGPGGEIIQRPDGSTIVDGPSGSTETDSDGTVTVTGPDGSSIVTSPDGTTEITSPDGSTTVTSPDGSSKVTMPDGTVQETAPDGEITLTKPDGTVIVTSPDGSATVTNPDGSVEEISSDGTVTSPDGSTVVAPPESPRVPPGLDVNYPDGNSGNFSSNTPDSNSGQVNFNAPDSNYAEFPYDDTETDNSGPGNDQEAGDNPFTQGDQNGPGQNALGGHGSGGGGPMMPPMGGMQGAGGGGDSSGERERSNPNSRISRPAPRRGSVAAQAADRRAAAQREQEMHEDVVVTRSGGPLAAGMPPPAQRSETTQSGDRERSNWMAEDEDVWGTDEGTTPAVIGR